MNESAQQKLLLLQEEAVAANRTCTVRVFVAGVSEQTRILLLRRSTLQTYRGQEEPPGGRVEPCETLLDAAIREVFEESGLYISHNLHFLIFRDFTTAKGTLVREFFFFATILETPGIVLCPLEHCSYRWVLREDIAASEMHPMVRDLALNNFTLFERHAPSPSSNIRDLPQGT